ncbi:MAG: hypothetical protein BWY31_04748 [Lentisphaerae bacterium ADurb.Bin242]|nr:MAG: hypothetical protein BWY31_04748 [Lentisphaerae bacterium ADurb.Bin242]
MGLNNSKQTFRHAVQDFRIAGARLVFLSIQLDALAVDHREIFRMLGKELVHLRRLRIFAAEKQGSQDVTARGDGLCSKLIQMSGILRESRIWCKGGGRLHEVPHLPFTGQKIRPVDIAAVEIHQTERQIGIADRASGRDGNRLFHLEIFSVVAGKNPADAAVFLQNLIAPVKSSELIAADDVQSLRARLDRKPVFPDRRAIDSGSRQQFSVFLRSHKDVIE